MRVENQLVRKLVSQKGAKKGLFSQLFSLGNVQTTLMKTRLTFYSILAR
jgi:hypothetical protein